VTAWGDGNPSFVWGDFRQGQKGSFISVKINASVTHDAGATWPRQRHLGLVHRSFVPVPTVGRTAAFYVASSTRPTTRPVVRLRGRRK